MIDYQDAKTLAADTDPDVRRRLAERADVQHEILYYLAEDADPEVRAAIAANQATPRHADLLLAKDGDPGVRERLAHKIGRLAPDLSQERRAHIKELTLDVIAILAGDRTTRIRQIIAEALKDLTDAPEAVIRQLARDVEIRVAGPILECSPLLDDAELTAIIESEPIQGALEAIARRRRLGATLSDALVAAAVTAPDGALAVAALLQNHDAEIAPGTIDRILDLAPQFGAWHAPLVARPALPPMALRRLAGFVSHALLDVLLRREDTDPETASAVAEIVERRVAEAETAPDPAADNPANPAAAPDRLADDDDDAAEPPVGDTAIIAAIGAGEFALVVAALARDSGFPRPVVRKVLASSSAKAIVSLAWKAGYSMQLASALQTGPGRIPVEHSLMPREEDNDYPLSESEMEWQVELFQVPTRPVNRRAGRARASA